MLQQIPHKYIQLALLNIGLLIALYKQMTLLGIIASLAFIILAVSPLALYFEILPPPPHQLVPHSITDRLKNLGKQLSGHLQKWQHFEQPHKTKIIIKLLLTTYVCYTFLCPCLQTFLIINLTFVYIFMQEQFQTLCNLVCSFCGCNPSA